MLPKRVKDELKNLSVGRYKSKSNYFFSWYFHDGLSWFRIGKRGVGIHVKDTNRHPKLFSQRLLKKGFSFKNIYFSFLKPVNSTIIQSEIRDRLREN